MKQIKVLHVGSALGGGGVEMVLYNFYSNMDRSKIHFDFIVNSKEVGMIEQKMLEYGSQVCHLPGKKDNIFKYMLGLKKVMSTSKYDIIHVHQDQLSFIPLFFAMISGIKIRIAHCHNANIKMNIFNKCFMKTCGYFTKLFSTKWFACGLDAGRFLWGNKAVKQGKVFVLNNAIDIDKFTFNADIRNQMRKELGIEDKFVIGNVGRLSYQKNHEFLIRIFNEIYKIDKKAVLLLVGKGELEENVKEQVKNLGLSEAVKFLGVRNDVPCLLQAMDVFLLPSRYEGLPVVLVEAQTAGLPCFASSTITAEIGVTKLLHYISLDKPAKYWAHEILKYACGYERIDTSLSIKQSGYDIKQEAKKLEQFYMNTIKIVKG